MRENYKDGTEIGPAYCRAVKHGNMIFVGGTGAYDKEGRIQGATVEEQTRAIYKKIEDTLAHFGSSFADVVRIMVWIVDFKANAAQFSKVHGEVFADYLPTTTGVGVDALAGEMLVEIEVQAITG